MSQDTTYKIVRFFQRVEERQEMVETGLSLEEAQAWCEDPETSSSTCTTASGKRRTREQGDWFEGYREE